MKLQIVASIVCITALTTAAPRPALAAVTADRPATVLLVTSVELAEAWQPFADWKTRQGRATKIVTVKSIKDDYTGDDIQQKIRSCILAHVQKHGTKWVVLGGDSQPSGGGHVPDRDTRHASPRYTDIPTDVYFISPKNWDANGDGVYGDWKHDAAEIAYVNPKACIGRIPVRTTADVAAYTEKVVAYESRYPVGKFAQTLVYTCPESGAYPKLNTSWKTIQADWSNGTGLQFFANKSPWDEQRPGDYDLTPDRWAKMINDHVAGKLHMHGHGFLPMWLLEDHQRLTSRHVGQLENVDALPVITTVSCFTGQFDSRDDPAITESMLRKSGGGAIAFVAPAREGVPVFHDPRRDFRLMLTQGKMDGTTQTLTRFWQHGVTGNLTLGEALAAAKADMIDDARKTAGFHWCQCELNLLGDPTLDMRSRPPTTPMLHAPKSIGQGQQSVSIRTAPAATVCLWKGTEVYEVLQADDQGAATIIVSAESPGTLLLTVAGPNLNVVTRQIAVR